MFRIAHLTDPHVGPLPRPRLRELLNKRITGFINYRRGRQKIHDMEILTALVADIRAQAPDHIACTGDLCNIGLKSEWETSRVFLEGLGAPEGVSFVPGNHDAYVPGSLEGMLAACGEWTRGDDGAIGTFPYLRRRGPVAIVGLSSAIPTVPFVATGRLGRRQTTAAEKLLGELEPEGCFRIVLIHHPPHVGGAKPGRHLTDARDFEGLMRRVGAELVLHGHNHTGSLAWLPTPKGQVPIIGAPSASSKASPLTEGAEYNLYTIGADETGFFLMAERRGIDPDGRMGRVGMLALKPGPGAGLGATSKRGDS
jgi:3',5'-cyclic AMP phosphodiesterase CpdA